MPPCPLPGYVHDIIEAYNALRTRCCLTGTNCQGELPDNVENLCGDGNGLLAEIWETVVELLSSSIPTFSEDPAHPRPAAPGSFACITAEWLVRYREWIENIQCCRLPVEPNWEVGPEINGFWDEASLKTWRPKFYHGPDNNCPPNEGGQFFGSITMFMCFPTGKVWGYVGGEVEQQDPGYDAGVIWVGYDPTTQHGHRTLVEIISDGGGKGCHSDIFIENEGSLTGLGTEEYLVACVCDSLDPLYHDDGSYQFEIFFTAPPP